MFNVEQSTNFSIIFLGIALISAPVSNSTGRVSPSIFMLTRGVFSLRLLPELVSVGLTVRLGELATGSACPSAGPENCFPVPEHCCSIGDPGVAVALRVPGTVVAGLGPVLLVGDSWNDIPRDHKPNKFFDVVPSLMRGTGIVTGPILDYFLMVSHFSIMWLAVGHSVVDIRCC